MWHEQPAQQSDSIPAHSSPISYHLWDKPCLKSYISEDEPPRSPSRAASHVIVPTLTPERLTLCLTPCAGHGAWARTQHLGCPHRSRLQGRLPLTPLICRKRFFTLSSMSPRPWAASPKSSSFKWTRERTKYVQGIFLYLLSVRVAKTHEHIRYLQQVQHHGNLGSQFSFYL